MSVLLSVFGLFLTFLFGPVETVDPVENMDRVQTTMVECTGASFGRKLCRTTHYDDGASLIYRDQLTLHAEAAASRPFAGQDNWQLDLHSVGVSTRLDTKKFRLYGQLGGLIYRTSLGNLQSQRVLPAPRFLVLYRLSRRLHVSGSFREQIRLPSLEQTTQLSIQQDQIAVLSGKLSTIRPSFTRDFQVSVFKPVQAVEFPLLFNASLVYRPAYIEPQLTTRFVDGFQENQFQYVQVQREFLANVFLLKSRRERSFSLRLNASVKDFTQGEQQVRDEFISLSTTLRFFQFGRWSTQFSGQLSLLNRLEAESTISGSLNAVPELSIVYTHKNTICELTQRYLFNDFRSGTNQYHRVDFNLTRKKLFKQVEATLSVIDLLNFQPSEQAFSAFGQNYFETYSYQVLPGRILLGLKWYFE